MRQCQADVALTDLGVVCVQLLNEYSPIAAGFLGVLIPIFEPVGWSNPVPGTLLGYQYSFASIAAIAISAALGLLVRAPLPNDSHPWILTLLTPISGFPPVLVTSHWNLSKC